jgi:hypothetical protein
LEREAFCADVPVDPVCLDAPEVLEAALWRELPVFLDPSLDELLCEEPF